MPAQRELKDTHPLQSGQGHSTINLYNSVYTVNELRVSMVLHSVILMQLHP